MMSIVNEHGCLEPPPVRLGHLAEMQRAAPLTLFWAFEVHKIVGEEHASNHSAYPICLLHLEPVAVRVRLRMGSTRISQMRR